MTTTAVITLILLALITPTSALFLAVGLSIISPAYIITSIYIVYRSSFANEKRLIVLIVFTASSAIYLSLGQLGLLENWSGATVVATSIVAGIIVTALLCRGAFTLQRNTQRKWTNESLNKERFAAHIHDRIGHELTLANLRLQNIAAIISDHDSKASADLTAAVYSIDNAMQEMYSIIDEIFNHENEKSTVELGTSKLNRIAEQISSAGVDIKLDVDPAIEEHTSATLKLAEAVAREGMINAVRHGDTAKNVTVSLTTDPAADQILLNIRSSLIGKSIRLYTPRRGSPRGLDRLTKEINLYGGTIERTIDNGHFVLMAKIPDPPPRKEEQFQR